MAQSDATAPDYKDIVKRTRLKDQSFAALISKKNLLFGADHKKSPKQMWQIVRGQGSGSMGAYGTARMNGSVFELHCVNSDVPPALERQLKAAMKTGGGSVKVAVILPDATEPEKSGSVYDSEPVNYEQQEAERAEQEAALLAEFEVEHAAVRQLVEATPATDIAKLANIRGQFFSDLDSIKGFAEAGDLQTAMAGLREVRNGVHTYTLDVKHQETERDRITEFLATMQARLTQTQRGVIITDTMRTEHFYIEQEIEKAAELLATEEFAEAQSHLDEADRLLKGVEAELIDPVRVALINQMGHLSGKLAEIAKDAERVAPKTFKKLTGAYDAIDKVIAKSDYKKAVELADSIEVALLNLDEKIEADRRRRNFKYELNLLQPNLSQAAQVQRGEEGYESLKPKRDAVRAILAKANQLVDDGKFDAAEKLLPSLADAVNEFIVAREEKETAQLPKVEFIGGMSFEDFCAEQGTTPEVVLMLNPGLRDKLSRPGSVYDTDAPKTLTVPPGTKITIPDPELQYDVYEIGGQIYLISNKEAEILIDLLLDRVLQHFERNHVVAFEATDEAYQFLVDLNRSFPGTVISPWVKTQPFKERADAVSSIAYLRKLVATRDYKDIENSLKYVENQIMEFADGVSRWRKDLIGGGATAIKISSFVASTSAQILVTGLASPLAVAQKAWKAKAAVSGLIGTSATISGNIVDKGLRESAGIEGGDWIPSPTELVVSFFASAGASAIMSAFEKHAAKAVVTEISTSASGPADEAVQLAVHEMRLALKGVDKSVHPFLSTWRDGADKTIMKTAMKKLLNAGGSWLVDTLSEKEDYKANIRKITEANILRDGKKGLSEDQFKSGVASSAIASPDILKTCVSIAVPMMSLDALEDIIAKEMQK